MGPETTPQSALNFRDVSKRYGHAQALQRLDLRVAVGTTFGLIGANGAGKTTLIRCMLDFCDLDEGHIEIFDVPSLRPNARRRLAFLPERFSPAYYLTGQDFLNFMAKMYGVAADPDRVLAVLASLDLPAAALRKPVRSFSKGMTQKLGLAACLLSNRDLIVLDEPTSGLDPKARMSFKTAIFDGKAAGRTVFLTSHALADVAELCDSIGVLHAGELKFVGRPAELIERYRAANLEAAYLASIA